MTYSGTLETTSSGRRLSGCASLPLVLAHLLYQPVVGEPVEERTKALGALLVIVAVDGLGELRDVHLGLLLESIHDGLLLGIGADVLPATWLVLGTFLSGRSDLATIETLEDIDEVVVIDRIDDHLFPDLGRQGVQDFANLFRNLSLLKPLRGVCLCLRHATHYMNRTQNVKKILSVMNVFCTTPNKDKKTYMWDKTYTR